MKRRFRTGDQFWVRERNTAIVLNYLWEAGQAVSRTHLVEASGLTKSTVGSILSQLESWGFVRETGMSGLRPGRPGVLVDMDAKSSHMIGVEIGVGFVAVVAANLKGQVIWRGRIELPDQVPPRQDQAGVLQKAERLVREAISATALGSRLLGIGVTVPGLVDHATGTLLRAPDLKWTPVPLADLWQKRFNTPVIVENDANAAALGERMLGVARQVDNFFYLYADIGLGGAIIIGGELYGGARGFAGEIGHTTLVPDGPPCNCGNRGCWETLIGPVSIVRRVRQAVNEGRVPSLISFAGTHSDVEAIRMEHVLDAAAQGEPAVLEILQEVGHYLGIGIANLVNAFDPGLVVMGGVMSLAGPYILPCAQQEINARVLLPARQGVQVNLSAFKFDCCVMGGVALVLRQILTNPAAWRPRPADVAENKESLTSAL